jgi:hypothetical protein
MIDLNPKPVIGIVSQPITKLMEDDPVMSKYSSYIVSQYVDFIKA